MKDDVLGLGVVILKFVAIVGAIYIGIHIASKYW